MIVKDLPRVATGDGPMIKKAMPMTTIYYPQKGSTYTPVDAEIKEEWTRDTLIRKLARETPLRVGMRVRAAEDALFEAEGFGTVLGICQTYKDYCGNTDHKDVKWPESGNPMIVDVKYDNGMVVHATTNYFIPAPMENA